MVLDFIRKCGWKKNKAFAYRIYSHFTQQCISYFVYTLKSRIDCSKVLAGHKVKDVSSVSFTYRTVRGETVFRCQIPNESDVLQRLFFFVLWEKKFSNFSCMFLNPNNFFRF